MKGLIFILDLSLWIVEILFGDEKFSFYEIGKYLFIFYTWICVCCMKTVFEEIDKSPNDYQIQVEAIFKYLFSICAILF